MKRLIILFLMVIVLFGAVDCYAVDPFENNVGCLSQPNELYFILYPAIYTAQRLKDSSGATSMNNIGARAYETTLRLVYYNQSLLGNTIILSGMVPVGKTDLLGSSDAGIGDAMFVAGYWLVDDKASGTYVAAGSYLVAPTGSYNSNRIANLGANVWQFMPTVVAAKQIGKLDMELTFKYDMFTENKATGVRAGNEAIIEGYAGYFVRPDLLLGGHLNATFGAENYVNGSNASDTAMQKLQAGPSAMWISGRFSALVVGLADFASRNTAQGYTVYARLGYKLF
ncbi:MAG: transporter [Candidatus Magnetominusculus sp. LBB02]|nr:transporter [Candidatus Magnetominusculus sp. LBB02]